MDADEHAGTLRAAVRITPGGKQPTFSQVGLVPLSDKCRRCLQKVGSAKQRAEQEDVRVRVHLTTGTTFATPVLAERGPGPCPSCRPRSGMQIEFPLTGRVQKSAPTLP